MTEVSQRLEEMKTSLAERRGAATAAFDGCAAKISVNEKPDLRAMLNRIRCEITYADHSATFTPPAAGAPSTTVDSPRLG